MTRKDAIQKALASIYSHGETGNGTMVESCAKHLDDTWPKMEAEAAFWADKGSARDLEHEVMLQVWNWFPGGGTAQIAAKRIMEEVNED